VIRDTTLTCPPFAMFSTTASATTASATTTTVNTQDIIQHQAFLHAISKTLPNQGKTSTITNLSRYQDHWLPLVALYPEEHLIPPLDIAWIWHVHRLAPLLYAAFCKQKYGMVLNNHAAFEYQLHSQQHMQQHQNNAKRTRVLWKQHYPGAFFYLKEEQTEEAKEQESFVIGKYDTSYDLAKACSRQSKFVKSISVPLYRSKNILTHAIQQYHQFLLVVKRSREQDNQFMVPSIAIDLVWHTHQLLSTSNYIEETTRIAGFPVNHNDNIEEEEEDQEEESKDENDLLLPNSKLQMQWSQTRITWKETFGSSMNIQNEIPVCIENFISEEKVERILCQLPSNGGYDSIKGEELQALKTSAMVPSKLKESIHQAMFTTKGGTKGGQCNNNTPSSSLESLPVRIKKGPAKVHQDRVNGIEGNPPLDAFVAILYLKGAGTMRFVNIKDKSISYDIDIKPYSLIFFPNAMYTHEVIPKNKEPRVMLGPLSFDGRNVVPAGDCGGCSGGCGSDSGGGSSRSSVPCGEDPCTDTAKLLCLTVCVPPAGIVGLLYYFGRLLPNYKKQKRQQKEEDEKWARKRQEQLARQQERINQSMANHQPLVLAPTQQQMNRGESIVVTAPPGSQCGDQVSVSHFIRTPPQRWIQLAVEVPYGVVEGQEFYVQAPAESQAIPNTQIAPSANNQMLQVPQVLEKKSIVDQDGKIYQIKRPLPPLTIMMLEGIETIEEENSVERLRAILATIGTTRITAVFNIYDTNKSGGLDNEELLKVVKKLTMSKPTKAQIQAFINNIQMEDADGGEETLDNLLTYIFHDDLWLNVLFEQVDIDQSDDLDKNGAKVLFEKIIAEGKIQSSVNNIDHMVTSCMQGKAAVSFLDVKKYIVRSETHEVHTDPATGHKYTINKETGESTWVVA
jgi:hypothetical protein